MKKQETKKFVLRLPEQVKEEAQKIADKKGRSLNSHIKLLVIQSNLKSKADEY